MALNLQETELISTFDYGITSGDVISGSEYIWCINSKDNCLNIKSTRELGQTSLPYHDFGILSNENFNVITGADFEYKKQKYLVLSIEVLGSNKRNLLTIFKLSVSKVTCSFQVPYKPTNLQVLVKNVHYIETSKNASFLGNFEVSCLAACAGGAVQIFDITPSQLYELNSNEAEPLQVYWIDNTEELVNDDIDKGMQIALKQSKIFGFFLNKNSLKSNSFDYVMANDQVTASLPIELVKITSLKYEKQIDSVLVGFNFGCFQIWSMKTLSIESSSGYGENSKPVVGFSLLQPQNDPQKCVYLIVAHSRSLREAMANCKKAKMEDPDETCDENKEDEFEIDEDDDESESSFILMYQLIYDKCVNVFLSQNDSYMLYESINHCGVVFDHEFSLDTLKCVKTNYSNELSKEFSTTLSELFSNEQIDSSNSKIISIQSTSVCNNRLQLDLACIIWALADKSSATSDNFFLSVFNLNNWYMQCMPSKMKPMGENPPSRKNAYFTNYTLSINCELDAIKFISLVDTKIRKVKNQNNLSIGNALRDLLVEVRDTVYDCDDTIGYDIDEETYLSMSFDLMMLTPFTLTKLSIKPIEHQIHQFISQQDDLIHYPEKVFFLLTRYQLIDKFLNDDSQPKFIPIFDYLLETSQIYAILKSLWKLNTEETVIMSDCSLKTVLDWSWSKVCIVKKELNNLNNKICAQLKNYFNRGPIDSSIDRDQLSEFLNRENNTLENLIQIFKQFLKLNSTSEGHEQLNKKLCIVESIKCYAEHLMLFNKYELILPPLLNTNETDLNESSSLFKNYLNEIQGNFKIIQNRCVKRRQEQTKQKYPFTYMIDCLIEECMPFANVSKFFLKNKKQVKFSDQGVDENLTYPPKSILELLEICLECNLSTKMKQILILYVLCDLMHTEMSDTVKKHILKVINAYCSTSFTIMSTNLDAAISVPWSSSVTSIVSLGTDPNNPNQSSCLFDLVNGLYLIDSHFVERSFKYLRGIDVNYLEFYEKYFILYNSACLNEFKMAGQYLWLFQKLNASSIPASAGLIENISNNVSDQSDLLKLFPKTIAVDTNLQSSAVKHEQTMHARLMLTIYLANNLVNEAYELVKPHLVHLKTNGVSSSKLSKELLVHFFSECENFKHWKQITKLASLDSDFLLVLLNYLEAKKDVDSIGKAIDLHVNNRNYKKAIQLYEKYHNLIVSSSEFTYLSSMIDIAKEMQNDYSNSETSNQYNLITNSDLREAAAFEYKFSLTLKEVCKNSKRCLSLLNTTDDLDYINLLKFSDVDMIDSSLRPKVGNEITNILSNETPSREFMSSACKKRKASTPHPNHIKHMIGLETPDEKPVAKHLFMSEFKDRVLTSALKSKNITHSVSKSVKFKTTRITREFNNDNVFDREEEEKNFEENQENVPFDDAPKRLEFDDQEEKNESVCSEKSTMADSEFELKLEESTKMEEESMCFEEKKLDIDSMISQIPILSQTDEIKKSIFEKVTSSARKSISELDKPLKSSITVEPIVNAALLHKCSTVKEFESPFHSQNKYSLDTTPYSPIRNESLKKIESSDLLNQEFIEVKTDQNERKKCQVNFDLNQMVDKQLLNKETLNQDEIVEENDKDKNNASSVNEQIMEEGKTKDELKDKDMIEGEVEAVYQEQISNEEKMEQEEEKAEIEEDMENIIEKEVKAVETENYINDCELENNEQVGETREMDAVMCQINEVSETKQNQTDCNESHEDKNMVTDEILMETNEEITLNPTNRFENEILEKDIGGTEEVNEDKKIVDSEKNLVSICQDEISSTNEDKNEQLVTLEAEIQKPEELIEDKNNVDMEKQADLNKEDEAIAPMTDNNDNPKNFGSINQELVIEDEDKNNVDMEKQADLNKEDEETSHMTDRNYNLKNLGSINQELLIEGEDKNNVDMEKQIDLNVVAEAASPKTVKNENLQILLPDNQELVKDDEDKNNIDMEKPVDLNKEDEATAPMTVNNDNLKNLGSDNQKLANEHADKNDVDTDHILGNSPIVNSCDLNDKISEDLSEGIKVGPSDSQSTVFVEETGNMSINSADRTLEEKNASNDEEMDLNMSSVSNSESKPMSSQESNEKLILPDEPKMGLSRSSSQTSLYSQISSVSEHMEEKRGVKRRAPVVKTRQEEIQPRATRTSTLRRKSELPKLETETRVTRGKSRASLEPEKLAATKTITRRNSKRTETKLEKVAEEEASQTVISAANLKKHNALTESEETKPKSARLTRSKARSPSPSASSIVSCSSVASVESTSTVTSVKTRGRKSKKIEEQIDKTIKIDEENEEETVKEENSPTTSVTSVSSVNSTTGGTSRAPRRSTRVKKEEDIVEEESSPVKKPALRKKKEEEELETKVTKSAKKTTRTRSFRETKTEEPEKPKVTRTRSLRSSVSDSKTSELVEKAKSSLSKINETAEAKSDSKLSGPRVLVRKYDSQK